MPPVSAPSALHEPPDQLPVRVRSRAAWHEPAVTFAAALISTPPDASRTIRYQSAAPLPVRERRFHVEHMQTCSRDGLALPTLPMPQRADVEMTPPNPVVRRFRAEQQDAATGWPGQALPVVVRLFGGSDSLPARTARIGAAHAPAMTYVPPQTLPVPAQTYSTNDVPPHRRPFVAPPTLDFSPWFQTALFPPFSANEMPVRKRQLASTDAPAFIRDFAAPRFCWSEASEPMRQRAKIVMPDALATPAGSPDRAPPMFGRELMQPAPLRSKGRTILDVQQSTVIVTTNEQTRPGAWRFEFVMPARKTAAAPWLAPVSTFEPRIGPIDGGTPGGTGASGDCPVELTGADNTTNNLTGEP